MAGDWIKLEKATVRKPEVFGIASKLGIGLDAAFAVCVRFWIWCDDHVADGNAKTVTPTLLDESLGILGFSDALISVGWLQVRSGSLVIPNFDRHLSNNAKIRAETNRRVAKSRKNKQQDHSQIGNAECNATAVTSPLPKQLPEKRREREENIKPSTNHEQLPTPREPDSPTADTQATWGLVAEKLKEYPVARVTDTVAEAKRYGFKAQQVLEWIAWLTDAKFPERKAIGGGAIVGRIRTGDAVYWAADFGWPPPSPDKTPTGTVISYPYASSVDGTKLDALDERNLERLEPEFGPVLDAMTDLDVQVLIGKQRGEINYAFRRSDPKSRLNLLWTLEKKARGKLPNENPKSDKGPSPLGEAI